MFALANMDSSTPTKRRHSQYSSRNARRIQETYIYPQTLQHHTNTQKMPNKQTTNQPLVTSQIVSRRFNHRLKAEPAKG